MKGDKRTIVDAIVKGLGMITTKGGAFTVSCLVALSMGVYITIPL